jgi:tetratricopeptide (TPR) repeat protein
MFLGLNGRDASRVRDANDAGARGNYDAAVAIAGQVHRAPAEVGALLATARALTGARRLRQADTAWAAVARRDPNNWQVHLEWARALVGLGGDRAAAAAHYRRARQLNPRLPALP